MAVAVQERNPQYTTVHPEFITSALLALPEFSSKDLCYIELKKFLEEHGHSQPPQLTEDMSWFDAGWRRHSVYSDILVPSGFQKGFYLVIYCQVTGVHLNCTTKRFKVVNPKTSESLFVGEAGFAFLQSRGWRDSVVHKPEKPTAPRPASTTGRTFRTADLARLLV